MHACQLTRVMWMLGVLLLFAQWGALAHAYSHDHAPRSAIAKYTHEKACAECQDFAPLLAGAASGDVSLHVDLPERCLPRDDVAPHFRESSATLAFRSRAPPTPR
jgi:hypothetical protein